MNGEPHAHTIAVASGSDAGGKYWVIDYGDQHRTVREPIFRNPEKVLKNAISKIILDHDKASRIAKSEHDKATRLAQAERDMIRRVAPQNLDLDKWGSHQLDNPEVYKERELKPVKYPLRSFGDIQYAYDANLRAFVASNSSLLKGLNT